MPRVKEIEEETPSTNVGGSRGVPAHNDGGNGTMTSTPTGCKANQLASGLKVLKLEQ
jgi:hypothetical protein